ncbi:hypothetical protein B0A52_07269 [Exophiala mesophila]|uniref:Protein kinase domain-containing protein n=1 Tax=Exophiala mesophila TaxID=212818 RepID=A0A438MWY5_EXOME|nr:hypothetical protein B0A52_07269 [Exophiala mesophila]
MSVRAPETLLDSTWDLRMDVWSLASTIFQLVTGEPPFDDFMATKDFLILEWIAMFGDVPEDWRKQAKELVGDLRADLYQGSLSSCLYEIYFSAETKAEFTEEDIELLGDLLTKMMCYLPKDRLSVKDILRHEWFAKNPF